jgi:sporulation protein YlmC with PRC-barrel domain
MQDDEPGGVRIVGSRPLGGPGPAVMRSDELVGNLVINTAGDRLGEIKALMIDLVHGRVAYAVLSFGGFLGVGDKLFAIPWHAFTLDVDRRCFILNIDRGRLKDAPGFDKDRWPAMADPQWAESIHTYYGQERYWS